MFVLNFLLAMFIIAILIVMISTIIKFSLIVVMHHNYESKTLVLPAIFNMLIWTISIISCYFILSNVYNIDLYELLLDYLLKVQTVNIDIAPIILTCLGFILLGILLQTFSFLFVNFNYKLTIGSLRVGVKKIYNKLFKKQEKEIQENAIVEIEDIPKISFSNALIASIFTFSILVVTFLLLFFVGTSLSTKILY